jgi:hypothetical protein
MRHMRHLSHMSIDQFLIRLDGMCEPELIRCPKSLVIESACPPAPAEIGKKWKREGSQ